jgi:Ca-activated chloride channel family protein
MADMSVHFIRPLWLLLLPLALLLPWIVGRFRHASGDWSRICDPHLLRWLSVGGQQGRPSRVMPLLAGLVLALAALSLAGPSWVKLPDTAFTSRDARVMVLDLSSSMLAQDVRPDRLTLARYRLSDILRSTEEGQMGLVAFAGGAFVVSPLTSDMNTISNMLPALQPDIIPIAGSRADQALELGASLLQRAGVPRGELLLVSDSAKARDTSMAKKLHAQGIVVSVLAVGSVAGAPIPSGAGFVTDRSGNVVIASMGRNALQEVARAGGGRYSELSMSPAAELPWQDPEGSEFALSDDALGERWKDMGPWLALLLLPLVAAMFRRGLLFVFPLLIIPALLVPVDGHADVWTDLWENRDQQAWQSLRAEQAEQAAAVAKDPALAGEAWFRAGDYALAAESWTMAQGADAHYNRGNALAFAGDLEAALVAYDQTLALESDHEDAIANKELIEQLKQQQEQEKQQQQDQEQQGEDQSQDQKESESEPGEEDQESEEGQEQEGDPENSEQQEQEAGEQESEPLENEFEENWSEEDAQAMEQWLRRIPDDPGGLLRRKFRNQHQRNGAPAGEKDHW